MSIVHANIFWRKKFAASGNYHDLSLTKEPPLPPFFSKSKYFYDSTKIWTDIIKSCLVLKLTEKKELKFCNKLKFTDPYI